MNLPELLKIAEAATPGEWKLHHEVFDNEDCPETPITALDGKAFVAVSLDWGNNNPDMRDKNAAHIAAFNPSVAIELIKRVQEAEKDAERYAYLRKTTKAIRDDEGKERIEVTPEEFDDAIDAAMNVGTS